MGNGKRRNKIRRSKRVGAGPGDVTYVGSSHTNKAGITLIDYNSTSFTERAAVSVDDLLPYRDNPNVTWINVDGVSNTKILEALGTSFNLHPLTVEDLANTQQRPKLEEYDDYLFVVLKMIRYNDQLNDIDVEQVSLVLANNWILSFQENIDGDVFEAVRERIRLGRGRIRKSQNDYLLYALIDAIVDHYFVILEKIGDRVEALEDTLIANPKPSDLEKLYKLKGQIYQLRRAIWPLRDVLSTLGKKDSGLLNDSTLIYIRDVYDHTVQVLESVEMTRDILSELLDIYLSSVSYRMNSIMKVLTIITTIFMPLSFIAGVYGMNFEHMPELKWAYGYPAVLTLMAFVTFAMLYAFRRVKWL